MHGDQMDLYNFSFCDSLNVFTSSVLMLCLFMWIGSTMLQFIPKYHTCGQTKEGTLTIVKSTWCKRGTSGVLPVGALVNTQGKQSSIHCFLPTVYGELSRSTIFNQLANKTCYERKAKRRSWDYSSCVASVWHP